MMKRTFSEDELTTLTSELSASNLLFSGCYPGEGDREQPVHTLCGGAHLFRSDSAARLTRLARIAFEQHIDSPARLNSVFGFESASLSHTVYDSLAKRLAAMAVECLLIDFEDGYGLRADDEENKDALHCAEDTASALIHGALPKWLGIRIKPLNEEHKVRSVRTLDLYLSKLADSGKAQLPERFFVLLPKVTDAAQVEFLHKVVSRIEERHGWQHRSIRVQLMIEAPQILSNTSGRNILHDLVIAADGRCEAMHFGAYDFTAACGVAASQQTLDHPLCDFARFTMQTTLAQTDIHVVDGVTTRLPVPLYRDDELTAHEQAVNRDEIYQAWREHYRNVYHALRTGLYQGWDVHPAQLVARYAALYSFFLRSAPEMGKRLSAFIETAARANLVGSAFDDAATGQGMLNFFNRGLACGALTDEDVASVGLKPSELQKRNFNKIVGGR